MSFEKIKPGEKVKVIKEEENPLEDVHRTPQADVPAEELGTVTTAFNKGGLPQRLNQGKWKEAIPPQE